MNKFFGLVISLLMATSVMAEEVIINDNIIKDNNVIESKNTSEDTSVLTEINKEEAKPIDAITHIIEKEIISMPTCDDATLIAKTKEFIEDRLAKVTNRNTKFRRRSYFILKGLNEYTKENIANYKTVETRPVSDLIVKLKINNNIIEENMLLCKNNQTNDTVGNIYLLVHPKDDGYRVFAINVDKSAPVESVYFDYK